MSSLSDPTRDDEGGKCGVCGQSFHPTTLDCLSGHWTAVDGKCVCDVCGKEWRKLKDALTHSRVHSGARPFVCDREGCDKAFAQKGNLTKHWKLVHDKSGDWVCPHPSCTHSTVSRSTLKAHVFGVHGSKKGHVCHHAKFRLLYKRSRLPPSVVSYII